MLQLFSQKAPIRVGKIAQAIYCNFYVSILPKAVKHMYRTHSDFVQLLP